MSDNGGTRNSVRVDMAGGQTETTGRARCNDLLLLEVVLSRAAGFAAGEGALVVAFSGVYAEMASEVTAGCETAFAGAADMLFLWGRVGGEEWCGGGGGGGGGLGRIGEVLSGGIVRVVFSGVTGHCRAAETTGSSLAEE